MDFELTYKAQLVSELIDLNEFQAVPLLVESIFGFRKEFYQQFTEERFTESFEFAETTDTTETTEEYYQEY